MARKKNLERAIVLGLLLSVSVYGNAWAMPIEDFRNSADATGNIIVDEDTIVDGNSTYSGGEGNSNSLDNKTITVSNGSDLTLNNVHMLKPNIKGDGNITINITDKNVNTAGIHVSGNITANSLTIDVSEAGSVKGINSYGDVNINAETVDIKGGYNGIFLTPEVNSANIKITAGESVKIDGGSSWGLQSEGSNKNITIMANNKDSNITISSKSSGGITNNSSTGYTYLKSGSIDVDTSHFYAVIATSGNITLEATNGNINIQGGQAGLRNKYGKVESLADFGSNNISLVEMGTMGGVQSDSGATAEMIVRARDYNRIYADEFGSGIYSRGNNTMTVTAGIDNIITGTTGIKSTGTGILNVTADGNNIIGVANTEEQDGYIGEIGIGITNGTVNLSAQNNLITANSIGVSVSGKDSFATLNAKNNYIGAVNEVNGDVTGIEVKDNGNFNLSKEDGFTTETVTVQAKTLNGDAIGIYLNDSNLITDPAIGNMVITAESQNGKSTGISLSGGSIFNVNTNTFEINATAKGDNSGDQAIGIEATTNNTVDITTQNGIEINSNATIATNYGNYDNSVGIMATTGIVNLEAANGNIIINAIEKNKDGTIKNIEEINYHTNGIMSNMGSQLTLESKNNEINGITGISISGSNTVPDTDGSYVVIPSTVKLEATDINQINSTVDGILVYGNNSDKNNSFIELNGRINNIFVNAINGSMDLAHGIVAQNGSKVNIGNGENNYAEQTNIIVTNPVEGAITTYGIDILKSTTNINSDSINLAVNDKYPSTNVRAINADNSVLNFNSDITQILVNSDSSRAYGIYSQNGSNMNFNAQNSNILQSGAYGILSYDSNINFDAIEGNNSILAEDYGIYTMTWDKLYDTNTVTMSGDDNIITATAGTGIYSSGETTTVDLDADTDNILFAGELAYYDAENGGGIYGNKKAIDARSGSTVTLDAGNANAISGAVYASGTDTTVDLTSTGQNTYSTNNDIRSAAVIDDAGGLDGKVTITDPETGESVTTGLDVVSALYAEEGASINLSGVNDIQTYYVDPNDKHTSERAVWAYKGADITIDGNTNISTSSYESSPNDMDIAIAAGTATGLDKDDFDDEVLGNLDIANVTLNYENNGESKSSITGDILSAYGGVVDIKAKEGVGRAVSDAGINIHGNLLAGNTGVLNVDIGKGSTLTGRADDYGDAGVEGTTHGAGEDTANSFFNPAFSSEIITGGEVNLTMGEGSVWNVTGQSWITSLTTTGNAEDTLISLKNAKEDLNSNASALTIGTLKGDTRFYMNLDGDRSASDMLYIKNADGKYDIYLQEEVLSSEINSDKAGNTFNGLRFATVGEGNAEFTVRSQGTGSAFDVEYEVGTDSYENNSENTAYNSTGGGEGNVEKPGNASVDDFFGLNDTSSQANAENNIMLMAETDEAIDTAANSTENSTLDEVTNFKIVKRLGEEINDTGKTILNMSRANYSNAIYMDRLNKRLGEARYINSEEDEGMWVRIRHDRIGKDDAYRSQNTMYELGYDQKQECDNGERRVGMAIDYMHGDTGYDQIAGKGEIDRYGLWLYDTWMGDKGHYADYVAKWGHLSNDFEVYTMQNGDKVTGDYSNNVFSVSAEYGRKKDIGNDWYFEPQVQAQLARVTGADYTTNQGTKVSVDGINSLIGRAGFRLGKDFGEEKQSTVYIKADVLHEFLGDQDVRVLDKSSDNKWAGISYENEGTWYDVGFGFATQMSKNSYAFMDFEKSFGNDNDETYQINVGMQWSF